VPTSSGRLRDRASDVASLTELQGSFRAAAAEGEAARIEELRIRADLLKARVDDPARVAALEAALTAATGRRREAEDRGGRARAELLGLVELSTDPVSALGGEHPIALLPVRIETRFVGPVGQRSLLVRVYPDDLHVDTHEPQLTDGELEAARRYWDRVWRAGTGNLDAERAAFVELARTVEARRAAWVARATAPDPTGRPAAATPDDRPLAVQPVLPQVPRGPSLMTRPAQATVLPDRWVVLGYRGGVEVARAVGTAVPDRLQVGLSPDAGPPVAGMPLEQGLRWLADFAEAERVGMGIRVPGVDERGFDRMLVLGVRASLDPAASAARLAGLLDAHRFSDGLGFVPAGTPTNNTDSARSGWDALPNAEEVFALERATPKGSRSNAVLAARGLGLAAAALQRIEHASNAAEEDARQMRIALWPATLGYCLETLMAPRFSDADVDVARDQFANHVRGLGPLPVLRVGSQPYGLLPATSLTRWRPEPGEDARHAGIVGLLRLLAPEWLARSRGPAPTGVPRIGRPGSTPDQELLAVLGRDALSRTYRVRNVRGPGFSGAASSFFSGLDPAGEDLSAATFALFDRPTLQARLRRCQFDPRTAQIRRPLVQHEALSEIDSVSNAPGLPNYLRWLGDRSERTASFPRPDSSTILFALLRHSGGLADADAAVRFSRPVSVVARKSALEPELVDPGTTTTASPTLRRTLAQTVNAASGGTVASPKPVSEFLATATKAEVAALGQPHVLEAFDRASAVRSAMRYLAGRPSAVVDRMAREVLDTCSHRLDAWITSYAARRLDSLRQRNPTGVHLGGYAWVEDLRPKPPLVPVATLPPDEPGPLFDDRTNAGFVHGPSLGHAAAAAVLRSGHLSHTAAGQPDGPLAIDLSSERVRTARWLLDGVRQGQPFGALLGYRFERGLHDRSRPGLELDRFIRRFRALAPLVSGRREQVAETVGAVEAVAATNVVDGLVLLRRFSTNPASIEPALAAPPAATPDERGGVMAELTALGAAVDAVADVLLAESTYQLVNGSETRAAATVDALGSGLGPPPELEVAATPRHGFAHTYRVLSLVPGSTEPAPGWEAAANRPRRLAEPRLERWAAELLGPARRIRAAARLAPPGGTTAVVRELNLDATGLCALDLIYDGEGGIGTSAVEAWIADRIAATAGTAVPPGTFVRLLHQGDEGWPGAAWPREVLPLDDALELAAAIRDVVATSRPAARAELAYPSGTAATGIDGAELSGRAATVVDAFDRAAGALRDALSATGAAPSGAAVARVRAALESLAGFGLAGAQPAARAVTGPQVNDPDGDGGALLAFADLVAAELATIEGRLQSAGGDPADRLRAVLGERFVVVPVFTAADPDELAAAFAAGAQPKFLDGDPGAPLAWLQRAGHVRERVGRLVLALLYGVTPPAGHRLSVAQLPEADRWAALPLGDREPPAAATSLVLHAVDPVDPKAPLAGLLVDEWVDVVPTRSVTTGVAFHFDEPGARTPHAILLAVPPEPVARWSLDVLAAVVRETADLARIRTVGPEEAPWVGRMLPALYFADNRLGDTLHVDFHALVTTAAP
jgi:hypothetical protein